MTNSDTYHKQSLPVIGILGDGQLAMMMAQAYQSLGGKVITFGASADAPATAVADQSFVGDISDFESVSAFFNAVDVVTLENEFTDSTLLSDVAAKCEKLVLPDPSRFGLIEDKLSEKRFFQELGIPQAVFVEVTSEADLKDVPGYLKIAKGGYDGIGTYRVESKSEATELFKKIQSSGVILFEEAVEFKKELSLIGVSDSKEIVFYPIVETHQEDGTCKFVTFPAQVSASIEEQAQAHVSSVLKKLDTRGLFAFEFFLTNEDQLILNESAPRPHNSGHITLDLADCSQFENHMRAVASLPLKKPTIVKDSMTMVNLLATKSGVFDFEEIHNLIDDPDSSATMYRKNESRVKRKMGHVNLWGSNQQQRAEDLIRNLDI